MSNPLYDSLFGLHANNPAILFTNPLDGNTVSFSEFVKHTAQCANAITQTGLQPGDRLVAQVGKSISAIAMYAACTQAGVVYLPLNTAYTANEVDYFLGDSGGKLLICDPSSEAALQSVANENGATLLTQSVDGKSGSFIDLVNASSTDFVTVARDQDDLAAFLYTSGTTGRSKGAMITQHNLLSNCQSLKELLACVPYTWIICSLQCCVSGWR